LENFIKNIIGEKMKLHTFVICAYKESPYLEECIKSLLIQESVALGMSDIVLYTATPSDFIDGICDKYNLKKVVGNSKGIGANWNEALSCSETKLATIAHQDDIYEKSYGIKIIESFQKDKRINIAFSDYYEIDGSGQKRKRNLNLKIKTLGLKFLSFIPNRSYQRRIYAFGNFICCPAVSYNLENLKNFKSVNTYTKRCRFPSGNDTFFLIFRKNSPPVALPTLWDTTEPYWYQ